MREAGCREPEGLLLCMLALVARRALAPHGPWEVRRRLLGLGLEPYFWPGRGLAAPPAVMTPLGG